MTLTKHKAKLRTSLRMALAVTATACLIGSSAASGAGSMQSNSWQSGMSQSSVFSLHTDRRGNIWMATEDGLNRYDGRTLHVYRNDSNDTASLPANSVRAVHRARGGRIWLATDGGGVAEWSPRSNGFRRFDRTTGLSGNYTRAITSDSRGYVWVAVRDGGLDRLDPASGQVTNYRHNPADLSSLSDNNVYAMARYPDGTLWVGTNAGLDRFDPTTGRFTRVLGSTGDAPLRVRAIRKDRRGVLWIGTRGSGLVRYDSRRDRVRFFRHDAAQAESLSSDDVQSIFRDAKGNIWVGTVAGLDRLDARKKTFQRSALVGGSGSVLSIAQSPQGSLLVGTELGGLAEWHPNSAGAKKPLGGNSTSSQIDVVTSFAENDQGQIYVGTVGEGLALVDRATGDEVRFRHDSNDAGSLSDDRVMSLLRDSSGRLWVGTQRNGLDRLDAGATNFVNFSNDPAQPSSLSANGVVAFHEDAMANIWVATYGGGLNAFDEESHSFASFRHDPADPTTLSSDRLTAIAAADGGQLWIGTDGGGLNLFDPATGTARSFVNDPMDPTTVPADTVCNLFRDASGTLWVGTRGGGLARMDSPPSNSSDPIFTSFDESDGLPNSVVYAIRSDSFGNLWLSTNLGLSHFDPSSQLFTNFDTSSGLISNEFNLGAVFASSTGELFFGSTQGYEAFYPDQFFGVQAPLQGSTADFGRQVVRASRGSNSRNVTALARY